MISSSPIRRRSASADSVVLPVPDSPNRIAASLFLPTLAEQCIDRRPCSGSRYLPTVKIVFLTTPQSSARPATRQMRLRGSMITAASERLPSRAGRTEGSRGGKEGGRRVEPGGGRNQKK